MGINKKTKLHTIFIRYLFIFCIMTFFLLVVFFEFISSNNMFPANYAENQLIAAKDRIASSEKVTSDLIPDLCRYAVYTNDGKFISGNLSTGDAKKAWNAVRDNRKGQGFIYSYLKIQRKSEICIIRYSIGMQFRSPVLRRYFPHPELQITCIFCILFITGVIALSYNFGRKINKKMISLQNAVKKIQNQDLDFKVESSGIFEIDNVLYSIDKMKEALKDSLEKEWNMEETRRRQISALAHDIKTPITIVSGNAELLSETDETQEQKEYTDYILKSTESMRQYVKTMIEISKADEGYVICKKKVDSREFVHEIYNNINALISVKKLKLDFNDKDIPEFFSADPALLKRAIMNPVSNAVEYSLECSRIKFIAEKSENYIKFCIIDSGKGFSKEDLKNAQEEFYRGDKSRNSNFHYGMGLFITKSIVKLHSGKLEISNSEVTGGGKVTIEIPIQ